MRSEAPLRQDPSERSPGWGPVKNAAIISVLVSLLVVGLKGFAWWASGSIVLLADAIESLVNVAGACAALLAIRIAHQPPDAEHPYGHGKAEYFSAGFEGGLVLLAALGIAWQGLSGLFWGATSEVPEALGLALGVSTIATVLNGGLAAWLIRVGRTHGSPALEADGRHITADVVTTVSAWVALGIASLTGWWFLDPLAAFLVAIHVAHSGLHIVRDAAAGLMDSSLPPVDRARMEEIITANLGPALEAHDLRSRVVSERVFIEFHLVVPGAMTVAESHALCDQVEAALEAAFMGVVATIHVEPEHEAHAARE